MCSFDVLYLQFASLYACDFYRLEELLSFFYFLLFHLVSDLATRLSFLIRSPCPKYSLCLTNLFQIWDYCYPTAHSKLPFFGHLVFGHLAWRYSYWPAALSRVSDKSFPAALDCTWKRPRIELSFLHAKLHIELSPFPVFICLFCAYYTVFRPSNVDLLILQYWIFQFPVCLWITPHHGLTFFSNRD